MWWRGFGRPLPVVALLPVFSWFLSLLSHYPLVVVVVAVDVVVCVCVCVCVCVYWLGIFIPAPRGVSSSPG